MTTTELKQALQKGADVAIYNARTDEVYTGSCKEMRQIIKTKWHNKYEYLTAYYLDENNELTDFGDLELL